MNSTNTLNWKMGATSSNINDIANDDFVPFLNVEEVTREEVDISCFEADQNSVNKNSLSIPVIHTSASDHSISNVLDLLDTNNDTLENTLLSVPLQASFANASEMKSSSSDVSISCFLDRENFGNTFDEHDFASVNNNMLSDQKSDDNDVNFSLNT